MSKSPAERLKRLRRDCIAVYFAIRDPRMPFIAKMIALFVVAYALSPVDIIPDFIPVIGYLDDLVIIPLGIWLVVKLTPGQLMEECRAKADAALEKPVMKSGIIIAVAAWVGLSIALIFLIGLIASKFGKR